MYHGRPGAEGWQRSGVFVNVEAGEAVVLEWDSATELLRASGAFPLKGTAGAHHLL